MWVAAISEPICIENGGLVNLSVHPIIAVQEQIQPDLKKMIL